MAQTVSTLVSNTTGSVIIPNKSGTVRGVLNIMQDKVIVPDTANADSVILSVIPVDCIPLEIEVSTADLGTAGTIDIGFFRKTIVEDVAVFVAVDKDCIANNLDVTPAFSTALVPQRMAGLSTDSVGKRAWEIAGLSNKPNYPLFYIGLTTDTGTTVAGSASVIVRFTE